MCIVQCSKCLPWEQIAKQRSRFILFLILRGSNVISWPFPLPFCIWYFLAAAFLQSIISFAVAMPYKIHFKYCSFQYILPLCVFVGSELEKYHTDAAKTICSYSYLVTIFRSYLLHVSKFLVVQKKLIVIFRNSICEIRVSYYNCKNVVMVLVKWNQISTLVTLVAKSVRWECKLNLTTNSRQKQG